MEGRLLYAVRNSFIKDIKSTTSSVSNNKYENMLTRCEETKTKESRKENKNEH